MRANGDDVGGGEEPGASGADVGTSVGETGDAVGSSVVGASAAGADVGAPPVQQIT